MQTKALVVATVLAGLVIFFWGAATHTLIPEPVKIIEDTKAVDEFAAKFTPTNDAYADKRGFMVIVGFTPDRHDRTQDMGPMLIPEFCTNLLQAFLLCLVLSRLNIKTPMGIAWVSGLIGLTAFVSIATSYGTFYGFTTKLLLMDFLDATIGYFLAGWVIGWQIRKSA